LLVQASYKASFWIYTLGKTQAQRCPAYLTLREIGCKGPSCLHKRIAKMALYKSLVVVNWKSSGLDAEDTTSLGGWLEETSSPFAFAFPHPHFARGGSYTYAPNPSSYSLRLGYMYPCCARREHFGQMSPAELVGTSAPLASNTLRIP
jgi:hypothetical protein